MQFFSFAYFARVHCGYDHARILRFIHLFSKKPPYTRRFFDGDAFSQDAESAPGFQLASIYVVFSCFGFLNSIQAGVHLHLTKQDGAITATNCHQRERAGAIDQ